MIAFIKALIGRRAKSSRQKALAERRPRVDEDWMLVIIDRYDSGLISDHVVETGLSYTTAKRLAREKNTEIELYTEKTLYEYIARPQHTTNHAKQ